MSGEPHKSDRQRCAEREKGRCRVAPKARTRCRNEEVVPVDEQETEAELTHLREQAAVLEEEVTTLRKRLQDAPKRVRTLEERLLETKGQLAQAVPHNEKLPYTLREAREHIAAL